MAISRIFPWFLPPLKRRGSNPLAVNADASPWSTPHYGKMLTEFLDENQRVPISGSRSEGIRRRIPLTGVNASAGNDAGQ
jgi:hypothetical protein